MSSGNYETKVQASIELVSGHLIGEFLLKEFKNEMIKQTVLQKMFGECGEHIFIDKVPNWNETILPACIFEWKSETFNSMDAYFTGTITGLIALPVKLEGDFNALRRVGSIFQRFMGGPMILFDKVPGLTMFGYGTDYNYEGLGVFDGFSAPAIQITIPFKFDLQKLQIENPEFDIFAPLDDADVGFVESYLMGTFDSETNNDFPTVEVSVGTGQEND